MQCLKCGYFMSPLDKDCARCRQNGYVPSAQNAPANPSYPAVPHPAPVTPPETYAAPSLNGSGYAQPLAAPQAPQYQPMQYQQPSYQQPGGPYAPPAPARPVSSRWSRTNELIGGTLGGIFIVTIIVLRVYLAVQRVARRDAINQSYAAQRQDRNNYTSSSFGMGQPGATVYVNSQPGFQSGANPSQFAAQSQANQNLQDMQQQNQQQMQNMQQQNQQRLQQMQQNRPTFGGGYAHRPGF